MTKSNELITMWSAAVEGREQGPYIVEQDEVAAPKLFKEAIRESPESWRNHESFFTMLRKHHRALHVNLIPEPYAGDIRRAPVVILMKNPGFDDHVYWDHSQQDYRRVLLANIRQTLEDGRPPFFSLRSEFFHTGNFRYFGPRFADLVLKVRDDCGTLSTQQALELLARTVCVVQMTGYISKKSPPCDRLASSKVVRDWVKEEVLPAVRRRERSLLVMRAVDEWLVGLDQGRLKEECGEDLYLESHPLNPQFPPGSKQGEIILRRVGEVAGRTPETRGAAPRVVEGS